MPSMMLHITPSERIVLEHLATGAPRAEIARHAGLDEREVDACLQTLFARMGVRNSNDAIDAAIRRGIVRA